MGPLTMSRLVGIAAAFTLLALMSWPAFAEGRASRLDRVLSERAGRTGTSRVIVRGAAAANIDARLRALGARIGSRLQTVDGVVAEVPNAALDALAADNAVVGLHFDRPVVPMLANAGSGSGRGRAAHTGDFDGSGVGVAIIDSGVTDWHDDLSRTIGRRGPNGQRVAGFVDFVGGAVGHVLEYAGEPIRNLSMEGRLTIYNMSIEAGARAGMIAPDETTFAYLEGRPGAPKGADWEQALDRWRELRTDDDATFDTEVVIDVAELEPQVTWGTNPGMVLPVGGSVPDPADYSDEGGVSFTAGMDYSFSCAKNVCTPK